MAEQMTPQYAALSNIESYVTTVEHEVAGLRVAVNEALLHCARTGESADQQAIERVRALHKVCTETPLEEGGCGPGDCDYQICAYDTEEWPCLTIRALEEGSNE